MRKVMTTVLVGALLLIPTTAHAKNPECRFGLGTRAMRRTIWCMVNKYPVPGGVRKALYIADRESGDVHTATNSSSGACGIYQHIPTYWPGRYATYSPAKFGPMPSSCYNGRTNIIVTILMVQRSGWGPWGG